MSVTVIVFGGDGPHPLRYGGGGGPCPFVYSGGEGPHPLRYGSAPLQSRLSVKLHGTDKVSLQAARVPVELTFYHKIDIVQRFSSEEYIFAILDSKGEQVEGGLITTLETREIVLTGRSSHDRPNLFLNPTAYAAGQKYQLICIVRNLAGAVTFEVTA